MIYWKATFLIPIFLCFSCTSSIPQANSSQTEKPTASIALPTPDEILQELAPKALEMAGYGGYHRSVSTTVDEAQIWFDRGLQLVYGFNHDAAVNAFAKAAQLDPDCAMAWWGIAYAYGVDVNNPNVSEAEAAIAASAIRKAMQLREKASPPEQALIQASAKRAVSPLPEERTEIDLAYSNAMATAWAKHPDDTDVGALYAESLMNMQSWAYWQADGEPIGQTPNILTTLESVMELNSLHPGANHFYIHAIEASKQPEKGIPSAERLEQMIPGSGHLVHMPSHIYVNVGRYADAVAANQRAIDADDLYFELAGYPTFYRVYFLHNMHFLAYSAMMTGQRDLAVNAMLQMEEETPSQFLMENTAAVDGMSCGRLHVYMRFGMWEKLVEFPDYDENRKVSRAIRSYTRTVALANLKRIEEARLEFSRFQKLRQEVPDDWYIGFSPADWILEVAEKVAQGEILWREGKTEEALATLREAVIAEDKLLYAEPPGWMIPVRHALGAILVAAGQHAEAVKVYQADLQDHPENAWSLLGLDQALRGQGDLQAAKAIKLQLEKAWANADVSPPASCYCGA